MVTLKNHIVMVILILGFLFLFSVQSSSHDFWIEKRGDSFFLSYGHYPHEKIPLDISSIKFVRCLNDNLQEIPFKWDIKGKEIEITGACSMILISYDHGYWSKTPDGSVHKPKNEVENPITGWRTFSFIKYLAKWNVRFTESTDLLFEIIPLRNPFQDFGGKGRFRVLFKGEPAYSSTLKAGHKIIGNVYKDGTANIRLSREETQIIKAYTKIDKKDEKIDYEIYEAILILEGKK